MSAHGRAQPRRCPHCSTVFRLTAIDLKEHAATCERAAKIGLKLAGSAAERMHAIVKGLVKP